jgi:hypothetical protein
MISYEYICKNGHAVWVKHRHAGFQAAREVKCFESGCVLKMSRTGNTVTKSGIKKFKPRKVTT